MNILICCAGGMSSSLLVQKMRDEVKHRNLADIKIGACAINQIEQYLNQADVLLIAPQINFISHELDQKHLDNLLVLNISNEEYGTLNASKLLDRVINKEKVDISINIELFDKINTKMQPSALKISQSNALNAISQSFISIMPITMIGSIFTLLSNLPFINYTSFLTQHGLDVIFSMVTGATTDLISIYLSFFIAYNYVRLNKQHGHSAGLLSLICFFLITGKQGNQYVLTYLGSNGIFTAIFIALITGRLYLTSLKLPNLKLPKGIPQTVSRSLISLFPSFLIITFFTIVVSIMQCTEYKNLHTLLYSTMQNTLSQYLSKNIFSFIFFNFITNLLWFFGIHGGNIVGSITNPLYYPLSIENFMLYSSGQEPINIISNTFSRCYISGGVGSMFSLSFLMTFFSKSQQYKTLGRLSLPTTFFFINEPLLFGMPIIMNPLYFIPIVFITPILGLLTFYVMSIGVIPIPIGIQLPWTTPPFIYGILQGGYKLVLWEFLMNILAMMMWYPFFKIGDMEAYKKEQS